MTTALTLVATLALSAHGAEPFTSFNGAAALPGCSGSLVHFEGQPMDSDAYVLTNGHCIGFLGSYEVLVDEAYETEIQFYGASNEKGRTWRSRTLTYGTMFETDMALLRLDATYAEILEQEGVDSLLMSPERGDVGEGVAIVSGYWEYITTCELDGFVHGMIEGDWTWTDSLRFTQECETFGGTSGSPVVSTATGEVIGVNNTGFEGGEPCTTNNPCEVDEDGNITTIPEGSYGQQTYQIYSCLTEDYELDVGMEGCALPVPSGVLQVLATELESADECDADGILDANETGTLYVTVGNDGPVDLERTTVTVSSPTVGLSFPAGDTFEIPPIDAFGEATLAVGVALDDTVEDLSLVTLELTVRDPDAAVPQIHALDLKRVDFDDVPNSATTDDVESALPVWTPEGWHELEEEHPGWTRQLDDGGNTTWYGDDIGAYGDQSVVSPVLEVGDAPFVFAMHHRYHFEMSDNTLWDGGVIELSFDDGETWEDAADYAEVPYDGTITDESGNPLANRRAFGDASAAWPEMSRLSLDFGTALAGRSVRLRFRVGTDAAVGDFGWEIDDIEVEGLTNLPFASVQEHDDSCGEVDDEPDTDDPVDPGNDDEDPIADEEIAGCSCSTRATGAMGWLAILGVLGLARRRR